MIINYIIPSLNVTWLGIVFGRYDIWFEGWTCTSASEMGESERIWNVPSDDIEDKVTKIPCHALVTCDFPGLFFVKRYRLNIIRHQCSQVCQEECSTNRPMQTRHDSIVQLEKLEMSKGVKRIIKRQFSSLSKYAVLCSKLGNTIYYSEIQ